MHPVLQSLGVVTSLVILFGTLELVRRGYLRSEYSLLWVISALGILGLSVFTGSLQHMAELLGIGYGPSLFFAAGFVSLLIIQITQNILLSRLSLKNRDLAQGLTIQSWHVEQLEKAQEQTSLRFAAFHSAARLSMILEWDTLVEQLLTTVIQLVRADDASLILVDKPGIKLYLEAATSQPDQADIGTWTGLDESIAGWVARNGEAVLLAEGSTVKCPLPFPPPAAGGSCIYVPLTLPPSVVQPIQIVGVICANRSWETPPFTQVDLELLTELSTPSAIALQNARQFKEKRPSQECSKVDVLATKVASTIMAVSQKTTAARSPLLRESEMMEPSQGMESHE